MGARVLVLGAGGMLGHTVFRVFAESSDWETYGTARSLSLLRNFPDFPSDRLICGVDAENGDALARAFLAARPDLVINCVGIIKQLRAANDPLTTLPVNALLPHRLAQLCEMSSARLIHVSTDCVFTGARGNYSESDKPDAVDLYGRSKLLGEVDYPHAVTLRTSIIGPELANGATGLIGWFLNQSDAIKGYRKAVFSGLPTVTLARIMRDIVAKRPNLSGLYHVSAAPIDKFTLLSLVRDAYGRKIEITPDDGLIMDRSLNSDRFRQATGYSPTAWPELVREMRDFG